MLKAGYGIASQLAFKNKLEGLSSVVQIYFH